MAGTIPGFSLTPQFDLTGALADGCKLYIIQAGTVSSPQNAYSDTALSILLPNPLTGDAAGRLPQWFVADGLIKLRLTDKNGDQIFAQDNLLVIGPSSGGGGGGSVDPTTILATGDMKLVYGTGIVSGFVRCNNRTIGSATSGSTERANADTSALFSFLWGADPNLAVSGGRGVSAAADFAANKTITLPDCRGRGIVGLADMGNSTSPLLNGVLFNSPGTPTTLGSTGGAATRTIATANLPPYTPSGSVGAPVVVGLGGGQAIAAANSSSTFLAVGSGTVNTYQSTQMGPVTSGPFTGNAQGGSSTPLESISPVILTTIYIKL